MGTYVNPGNKRFIQTLNSDIYVDKTGLISNLNAMINTEQKYVCISRPRRFGKSVTVGMIGAYYDKYADSRSLFENLELSTVENWDRYLAGFDVLRIVTTDFMKIKNKKLTIPEFIENLQRKASGDIVKAYRDVAYDDEEDLMQTMENLYQEKGSQFVILIDEWDAVFREYKDDPDGQRLYLDFLRDWLKDKQYVALAYMTGILPIKKYGRHSALNMFNEYSMVAPLQFARYTGFTEAEVIKLCNDYGRPFEDIREWYDGYVVTDAVPPDPEYRLQRQSGEKISPRKWELYSPLSVVKAVTSGVNQDYWNQTETYEALSDYVARNYDGLREDITILMAGEHKKIFIGNYQNDMTSFNGKDDVLTLLIHLGYLGYDFERSEVFVPNREVIDEFRASTRAGEWSYLTRMLDDSGKLLEATWRLDADEVAHRLEMIHDRVANGTYNSEAALSYAVQLAYYGAHNYYILLPELDSGKGYVDLAYIPAPEFPDKPALVIELKYNKSAHTALDQIRDRRYPDRLKRYKGNIIIVGINYDKEAGSGDYKHHSCIIEQA